jgi:transcription factor C subunit 6
MYSKRIDSTHPGKDGFLFAAGGPIWGLDWCPVSSSSSRQYLAVSTLRDMDDQPSIGVKRNREDRSAIQIWSMDGKGGGAMQCDLVMCVQGGAALDLKWMPLGAMDEVSSMKLLLDSS